MRAILNDFKIHQSNEESFLDYYDRNGQKYFYDFLKPFSETDNLVADDFVDWGHNEEYVKAVGVGECAGVVVDLVATLLFETEEKLQTAQETFENQKWADSIYHSYTGIVNAAKALLIGEGVKTNTQAGIIKQFEEVFGANFEIGTSFSDFVYQINTQKPSESFAQQYLSDAQNFYKQVDAFRTKQVQHETTK